MEVRMEVCMLSTQGSTHGSVNAEYAENEEECGLGGASDTFIKKYIWEAF